MNYSRIALAALGGTVAYFAFGFAVFAALPVLANEFRKHPALYRTQEEMKTVMPVGMIAMFVAIFVVTIVFAMINYEGSGVTAGAYFGMLIGIFVVCGFVLHNYVNLNIGVRLTIGQAVAYFLEWVIVGVVIGLIYKPATP
ncbi:MAG TPA: DUF1761 family protein [Blastocatellia bacterium]|nr:DUF1761 family protein [Blastocatellia bacterium]